MKRAKDRISDDVFIEVCKTSLTMNEASRKLGINYKTLRTRAKELNCFNINPSGKGTNKKGLFKYKTEDIFTKNSCISMNCVKDRIIKENLKEYKCEKCKLIDWQNEIISLELHHIDGDKSNNLLENLQYLCPNCHSQTENFRSKNSTKNSEIMNIEDINDIKLKDKNYTLNKHIINLNKKPIIFKNKCIECDKETNNDKFCSYECSNKYKNRNNPDKETLLNDFKELKSYLQIGKKYNVSDKCIKKWVLKFDIEEQIKITKKEKIDCIICGRETDHRRCCSFECENIYRNKNVPTEEILIEDLKEFRFNAQIAIKYNVSEKSIRNWIERYNLKEFVKTIRNN